MQKIAVSKDKLRRKLTLWTSLFSAPALWKFGRNKAISFICLSICPNARTGAKLNEIPLNLVRRNSAKYVKNEGFMIKLDQKIIKKDICNLLKPTGYVMHQQV